MPRLALWTVPAALLIALGASAPAVAGGGGGGCYQDVPALPAGWVAVLDSCFTPQRITMTTGEAVRWSAYGQIPHTVTLDDGPHSGRLTGSDFALRFNEPGTYAYACAFHPGMTGSVVVTGGSRGGPAIDRIDENGIVVESFDRATGAAPDGDAGVAAAPIAQRHRIEVDPLTALVVLVVLFPISMGAAMRLLSAPAGRVAASPVRRLRWRAPWYVDRPNETRPKTTESRTPVRR